MFGFIWNGLMIMYGVYGLLLMKSVIFLEMKECMYYLISFYVFKNEFEMLFISEIWVEL